MRVFSTIIAIGIALCISLPASGATIGVGEPTQSGSVTTTIVLWENGQARTVSWSASITAARGQDQKAADIVAAFPGDSDLVVTATPTAVDVVAINGVGIIALGCTNDVTCELTAPALQLVGNRVGLVSLSGTASGLDASGGAGYVSITFGEDTATVNTSDGQTAAEIEDALIVELVNLGIDARLAEVEDDLAGRFPGLEGDGRVILLSWDYDSNSNVVSVDIKDTDIEGDVVADALEAGAIPTISEWGVIVMTLLLVTVGAAIFARRRAATA